MPDALVLCGGEKRRTKNGKVLELDISPSADPKQRIRFDPRSIVTRLVDDLPSSLSDAVEVAAYVFSADRLLRRAEANGVGDEWHRQIHFHIPVRNLDLWRSQAVQEALTNALTFLSGDVLTFEFTKADRPVSIEPFLGFRDDGAQVTRPDKVMLFSGGLDSLAGVAEHVIGKGESAVLVAHQSANAIANLQNSLAHEIGRRTAPHQTFYAPIWVRRGQKEPVEHTQRLRSFLFAAIGMAYAHMFTRDKLYFFENGITSFNLPIAEQVIGTRASRTTHPRVLRWFGRLFSLLLDQQVAFENPFLWMTKQDIVDTIVRNGCTDLIGLTTSCASIRAFSMSGKQCGCCSQCVERRFAVLGSVPDDCERPGSYATDLFTGAHTDGRDLTMVESHLMRAQRLSSMSKEAFFSSYGQVFRGLSDIAGSPDTTADRLYQLHRRYGASVVRVFDHQSGRNSSLDALQNLPRTSLLAMARAPLRTEAYIDATQNEPKASLEAAADKAPVTSRQFAFAVDESRRAVRFLNGPVLKDAHFELLIILVRQYLADIATGIDKENFTALHTPHLVRELHLKNDQALRQRVMRMRIAISKGFEANANYTPDQNDIIQSGSWNGYRLNPYLILLDPAQFTPTEPSREMRSSVTTFTRDQQKQRLNFR